jgi:hypothetical protein
MAKEQTNAYGTFTIYFLKKRAKKAVNCDCNSKITGFFLGKMGPRFLFTLFFFFSSCLMSMLKRVIPKTGQQVSRLGFGSFRVSQPIHAQALTNALEGGINIIDTGSNFENGTYKSILLQ